MITKEQAVELLEKNGYTVSHDNGVPVVRSANREDYEIVGKILKKAGYECSYGWKKVVGAG